nr:hypothetical protein [Tanacetum cinerariifolium]
MEVRTRKRRCGGGAKTHVCNGFDVIFLCASDHGTGVEGRSGLTWQLLYRMLLWPGRFMIPLLALGIWIQHEDLYPVTAPSLIPHVFLVSQHTWHRRLRHPGHEMLRHLVSNNFISCNKEKPLVLCHACQLGKHVRLPFYDHGGEFHNRNLHKLFADNGIQFRFPCPKNPNKMTLVPRPTDINIVRCMWLFRHKYHANGTLSRYKVRLVANGSTQLEGVDVDETFSLIVKPGTIQAVLSLATSRHWPVHQLYKKYTVEIFEREHMVNCNLSRTPVDTESKLGIDGDPVSDPTLHRSLAGSFQYLTFTRLDISYAIQQIGLVALLLDIRIQVTVYFLATTYYLGPLSISRRILVPVQRQSIVVLLMLLLRLVGYAIYCASCILLYLPLYSDNVSDVYLFCNPVQHQRTKHIEIDIHFVHDLVAAG